jgi:hypothetical protein
VRHNDLSARSVPVLPSLTVSPLSATLATDPRGEFGARMLGAAGRQSARATSAALPMLTKRRPVDFCLVAASLCRCF